MRTWRLYIFVLVFSGFVFAAGGDFRVKAEEPDFSYSDAHIKAAYVLKIRDFVEWPDHHSSKVVCVIGDDLLGSSMAYIHHEADGLNGLIIEKKFISSDLSKCQILYLGHEAFESIEKTLNQLKGASILTISDTPDFVMRGGMIEFYVEDQYVRLKINNKIAKEAGLFISSNLLQIAREVIE